MTPNNSSTFNVPASCFTPFIADVKQHALPELFTFPYYYTPHPLATAAMKQLQAHLTLLQNRHDWKETEDKPLESGNMFAVLVVENEQGQLGYLSSYAGKESDTPEWLTTSDNFVNAVFDIEVHHAELAPIQRELDEARAQLVELQRSLDISSRIDELTTKTSQSEQELKELAQSMSEGKKRRKQLRKEAESRLGLSLSQDELDLLIKTLGDESSREKRKLKALKQQWQISLTELSARVTLSHSQIQQQQEACNHLVTDMDTALNKACQFLNQAGELKSLHELFEHGEAIPHSSEQNLPKLLQAEIGRAHV